VFSADDEVFIVWVVVGTPWKRKAPPWRRDFRPGTMGYVSDLISGSQDPRGENKTLVSGD